MGGCLNVRGCLSVRKKDKAQVASSHDISSGRKSPKKIKGNSERKKNWIPKNGIGRFVQTEEGTVIRTSQISDQHRQENGFYHKDDPHSYSHGSNEEVWFDSHLSLDSESDDDFRSVNGDSLPGICSGSGSAKETPRPTYDSLKDRMQNLVANVPTKKQTDAVGSVDKKKLCQLFVENVPSDGGSKLGTDSTAIQRDDNHHENTSLISCLPSIIGADHHENSSQKSCLPRILLPSMSFNDKKTPVSPGSHKSRNSLLRLSFKRHSMDHLESIDPVGSHGMVERPPAGSQIPFCTTGKLEGSWSAIAPSTFKLRGPNYLRDKVKISASDNAMYEPVGVDLYFSSKKINHIARHVELPACFKVGDLPSLLILNIQIPMYPAAIFQNETDGEGLNLVMYHQLSEKHSKIPEYFHDMFLKILNDDVEKVKGFAADSSVPFRERLKILGRVANPEDLHLSVPERKVVYAYNEKPVLSRPQHNFYKGEGYFEVDLDMHRFSYFARKGVESFRERLRLCILDLGLTIQGNKPDELPEHVLCCVRINKIDYNKCKYLAVNVQSSAKTHQNDDQEIM